MTRKESILRKTKQFQGAAVVGLWQSSWLFAIYWGGGHSGSWDTLGWGVIQEFGLSWSVRSLWGLGYTGVGGHSRTWYEQG